MLYEDLEYSVYSQIGELTVYAPESDPDDGHFCTFGFDFDYKFIKDDIEYIDGYKLVHEYAHYEVTDIYNIIIIDSTWRPTAEQMELIIQHIWDNINEIEKAIAKEKAA